MKRVILCLCILWMMLGSLYCQKTIRPNTFPLEPNPNNDNFEVYSQKNGVNRRATLKAIRKYILDSLHYVPGPQGPPGPGTDLSYGPKVSGAVPLNSTSGTGVQIKEGTGVSITRNNSSQITISATPSPAPAADLSYGNKSGSTIPLNITNGIGVNINEGSNVSISRDDATNITISARSDMPSGDLFNTLFWDYYTGGWLKTSLLKVTGKDTEIGIGKRVEVNNDSGGEYWDVGYYGDVDGDTKLLVNGGVQMNSGMQGDPYHLLGRDENHILGGVNVSDDSGLILDASGLWTGRSIFGSLYKFVADTQRFSSVTPKKVVFINNHTFKTIPSFANNSLKITVPGLYHLTFNVGAIWSDASKPISASFTIYINGSAINHTAGVQSSEGRRVSYTYDGIHSLHVNDEIDVRGYIYYRADPTDHVVINHPRLTLEWLKYNTTP